mmetsp:Transcript_3761/g.6205  ORF Transcript_3761/g.6205 Transcript_3761/m.6205 type:complete len:115 (+) Transcript_3761:46-390(+)
MVHCFTTTQKQEQPTACIASYNDMNLIGLVAWRSFVRVNSVHPQTCCCQRASNNLFCPHSGSVGLEKSRKKQPKDEGKSLPDTSRVLGHQPDKDASDRIGNDRNESMWRPVVEK